LNQLVKDYNKILNDKEISSQIFELRKSLRFEKGLLSYGYEGLRSLAEVDNDTGW
jgi:hypothetical protein